MSELVVNEKYRVMQVGEVYFDLADSSPTLRLVETESPFRELEIPVALQDGQAIRNAIAGEPSARPTTGELLSSVLERLNANIIDIRITRFEGGIFYSELDVMFPQGRETFDCRTSDAIALALRQRVAAPILCEESILG